MRKSVLMMILLVFAVFVSAGVVFGEQISNPAKLNTPIKAVSAAHKYITTIHKATPAQIPQGVSASSGMAVKELPANTILDAFNETRSLGGQTQVQSAPAPILSLSPTYPAAGQSFLGLYSKNGETSFTSQPGNFGQVSGGSFFFYLKTVPGKTYLLDLSLGSRTNDPKVSLRGAIQGNVNMQGFNQSTPVTYTGHLLGAFTATSAQTQLYIDVPLDRIMYFWKLEMRQVN
jgi:hypothetical protein